MFISLHYKTQNTLIVYKISYSVTHSQILISSFISGEGQMILSWQLQVKQLDVFLRFSSKLRRQLNTIFILIRTAQPSEFGRSVLSTNSSLLQFIINCFFLLSLSKSVPLFIYSNSLCYTLFFSDPLVVNLLCVPDFQGHLSLYAHQKPQLSILDVKYKFYFYFSFF